MSAAWMKANGMHRDSTPAQLRNRAKFAPNLPPLSPKQLGYAGLRAWTYWFSVRWNRLRIALFGQRFETKITSSELAKLSRVESTTGESRYVNRWTPSYVAQLAKSAVTHVKTKSKRFTQWALK